jgi:hypothetical protein
MEGVKVEYHAMFYVGVAFGLIVLGVILRYTVFAPTPRAIASLTDAEHLVNYHIDMANRRLRHDAWMLTFVVSHLDLDQGTVTVRIGIKYGRRGYPNYVGRFQQIWANAQVMLQAKEKISEAFAKRGIQADIETFS